MSEPSPTPDDRPRPEPSWVAPLAVLGLVVGQLLGGWFGSRTPGVIPGLAWGVILGLLARQFIKKDSRLAAVLQRAIRLLLPAAVVFYLAVTLVASLVPVVREWLART